MIVTDVVSGRRDIIEVGVVGGKRREMKVIVVDTEIPPHFLRLGPSDGCHLEIG